MLQFYNDYGDIIKYTLTKVREISKVQTAQTLAGALIKVSTQMWSNFLDCTTRRS